MTNAATTSTPETGMSGSMTALFALAGGVVVGNLYWAQPLLDTIGESLRVAPGRTGLIITMAQVGYALGVFFIVPLGDALQRRRLIPAVMAVSMLGLIATAFAPSYGLLIAAILIVGLSSVTGQLLTPLAGDLAGPEHRGRTIAIVASGVMFGVLVSRSIGGFIADLGGWRSVFVLAAALNLVMALVLARAIPLLTTRAHVGYGALLRSVLAEVRGSARLRIFMILGACTMAVFTTFWTGLTFLLSAPPYGFSVSSIGLVSLVGVFGALAAQYVGRLYDRGWAVATIGAGLAVTFGAMVCTAFSGGSLVMVLVTVAVSSVGIQAVFVLVQTSVMAINPEARSRLNTAIIVGNFIGGAIGSTLAALVWDTGGWPLLAGTAAALSLLGLIVWAVQRRRTLSGTPA
jgi:predicted MFS family arabinose efflux permease